MNTIHGVNVKEGDQLQDSYQVITASQLGIDKLATDELGIDQQVTGYIYETDQERGFICVVMEGRNERHYSSIMPLDQAQAWVKDQVGRIAAETKSATQS